MVRRRVLTLLYVSVAPVPCATVTNREWGTIGTNYFKGLCALAFQGFFMMVCVAIYAVLVAGVAVSDNLHTALWSVAAYTVILCFSMFNLLFAYQPSIRKTGIIRSFIHLLECSGNH